MTVRFFVAFACAAFIAFEAQASAPECTLNNRSYVAGEIACVVFPDGNPRLARCVYANGAAAWTPIADTCPNARLVPPSRPAPLVPVRARGSVGGYTPIPTPTR